MRVKFMLFLPLLLVICSEADLLLGGKSEDISSFGGAIKLEEIFSLEDWKALRRDCKLRWLIPSQEFIEKHKAPPEDPRLEESFWNRLRSFLKPRWICPNARRKLVYLKCGEGWESLRNSFFFFDCVIEGKYIAVKGFFENIVILIKEEGKLPKGVEIELAKARKTTQSAPPITKFSGYLGRVVLEEPYEAGKVPSELKKFIKEKFQKFLKPKYLDRIRWDTLCFANGGIAVDMEVEIEDSAWNGTWPAIAGFWTNGKILRFALLMDLWSPENDLVRRFKPKPSIPEIKPLNPDEVEYVNTNILFYGPPFNYVSKEEDADACLIQIRYKRPLKYELPFCELPRTFWVDLPLTSRKWRLCEFYTLMERALVEAQTISYRNPAPKVRESWAEKKTLRELIIDPETREEGMKELRERYAYFLEIKRWFSRLRYPPDLEGIYRKVKRILARFEEEWYLVLEFWEKVYNENPRGSREFYERKAEELERMRAERGFVELDSAWLPGVLQREGEFDEIGEQWCSFLH